MEYLYAYLIVRGMKTIDDVPDRLKIDVLHVCEVKYNVDGYGKKTK